MARALIHEIEANERRGKWFVAVAILLSIALLTATWVGLFAFMWANSAYGEFNDLQREYIPDTETMALDLPDVSRVSYIRSADGTLLAELHDGRISEPVALDEIPERVINAVLAAEDSDFYDHSGVDFAAIFSAALDNVLRDTRRGGSTITQQVVKNQFVGAEVTIQRKIAEAFVSAELERRYSKDQILQYYLNSVYFGSSAYGIAAAAREFFDKPLEALTVDEAATLSVLIRSPSDYDPRRRPERTLQRRDQVLDEMVEHGWLTEDSAEAAQRKPLGVIPHSGPFQGPADHVAAEVKRQVLNDDRFSFLGSTKELRKQRIFGCPADDSDCAGGGGLTIETTIDLRLQNKANEMLRTWFPLLPYEENLAQCVVRFPNDPPEFLAVYAQEHSCTPTGAIATVDNRTGAVMVMASGLPFDFTQFDLAVQGRRNPGSAFKVFALVAALENGISLGSVWSGRSPIQIQCPSRCSDEGNVWTVHNAGASYGLIDLGKATAQSVNAVYAQLAHRLGPEKIVEAAHRMGIQSPLFPNLSLVLGTDSVSPLEMASAFSNFATNGLWTEHYLITRIIDANDEVIYEHVPQPRQVVDPGVIAAAREPLTKVPTSEGTAERANIDRPQGGKTGTHQDYRDAWYVGFVPQYTTAVWVGFERDQLPLRNVTINGRQYERVFGGSVAAPIWAEFMSWMLQGVPAEEFPAAPPGTEIFTDPPLTRVPSVVGLTEEQARIRLKAAVLNANVQQVGSLEPAGVVVAQGAAPGARIAQGTAVLVQVSNGTPPAGPLPQVAGLYLETALSELRTFENTYNIRLDVSVQRIEVADPAQHGIVQYTTPAAGEIVSRGSHVTLVLGDKKGD